MAGAQLYVIPGSHPSRSAMLMLERKGIPYKRIDLIPVVSKGILRAQRFAGVTVPALKLEGRRIQGSTEIARELDRIQPDPALFPGSAARTPGRPCRQDRGADRCALRAVQRLHRREGQGGSGLAPRRSRPDRRLDLPRG